MTAGASHRRRALTVSALAGIAVLACTIAACGGSTGISGLASAGGAGGSGSPETGPAGALAATSTARPADPGRAGPFAGAAGYLAQRSGTALAAVYDVRTGQSWRLGDGPAQAEASVVKVNILEALLSDGAGTGLSPGNQGLAGPMIEDSDNDAATSLWYAAGGTAGLAAYNAKAGLTGTTASACVVCGGFPWPGWGLTTTVPYDQIRLLKQLVEPGPLLTAADRQYALALLENVSPDQAWGVSGGVPAGVTVALKNGWLPLNTDSTDWQINSEGWICGDGRDYLIAVLTTGNPTEQYGIDTIDRLSTLVWSALG